MLRCQVIPRIIQFLCSYLIIYNWIPSGWRWIARDNSYTALLNLCSCWTINRNVYSSSSNHLLFDIQPLPQFLAEFCRNLSKYTWFSFLFILIVSFIFQDYNHFPFPFYPPNSHIYQIHGLFFHWLLLQMCVYKY